jgi:predicted DNA-binding transcriptional regulator YafY
MSRSARLLELMQLLRRHRRPVTAATLATQLGISVRSVYRDVATLQGQGVPIDGEAGLGYLLRPGYVLPPLTFTQDELEALVLGLRWSAKQGDGPLTSAAVDALAKISSVLPAGARVAMENSGLLVPARASDGAGDAHLPVIRRAIRDERKLRIAYTDLKGQASERTVWPLALGFFEHVRMLVAWCELRSGFRHFRTDLIGTATALTDPLPRPRTEVLAQWRAANDIPEAY